MTNPETTPAEELQDVELAGGWKVIERVQASATSTGGQFSTQWIVERGGERAFLKAIDITRHCAAAAGK